MSITQTLHEMAKFQFILSEGRKGHHLLFSPDVIRDTFQKGDKELKELFQNQLQEVNEALNKTFALNSFEEKREFLASLPPETQQALVFGYFQLLEGDDTPEERALQ